ncbi:hypothetical protein I7I50_11849 [Histoplasma capsulatum G186AR]|uniref:Uncharacterized protein n=1 Tax=Ajellomyces capsulatus TaxID=5037 RepID=A0A8H7ZAB5_AJECA|nr:hypothetical protein I7I52_03086 [Histoplasma capsulatum]QSS70275.1 hypothetical protein I7I50_11849 [Histoplasma capsulatum G186AR]
MRLVPAPHSCSMSKYFKYQHLSLTSCLILQSKIQQNNVIAHVPKTQMISHENPELSCLSSIAGKLKGEWEETWIEAMDGLSGLPDWVQDVATCIL